MNITDKRRDMTRRPIAIIYILKEVDDLHIEGRACGLNGFDQANVEPNCDHFLMRKSAMRNPVKGICTHRSNTH